MKGLASMRHRLPRCLLAILICTLVASACGGQSTTAPSITADPVCLVCTQPSALTPNVTLPPLPTILPTSAPTSTPEGFVVLADGFCYCPLDDVVKARILGISYPADGSAKISLDELRYLSILYYDFEGNRNNGELIINARLADELLQIFYELYLERYPLASVRLVDDFGEPADDTRSMEANNTSAFNYREVAGTNKLSLHSYGAAIDINPQFNPYVQKNGTLSPKNGADYADRTYEFPGKIDRFDLCYRLFTERGWHWGGDFKSSKDYQHFSKDLGY
ncbi:MAG: M15 family metallopeptidase [Clostridia bacterium]